MNTAEWIIVSILSFTLLVFLIVGIILVVKLIGVTKEAKKILITGQSIANKTDDIIDNVKDFTTVGGVVKNFASKYLGNQPKKTTKNK